MVSLRRELAEGGAPMPAAAGAIAYSQGCCDSCCNSGCDSCCNSGCGCCNSCCDSCVCDSCCGLDALAYQTGCGWVVFGEALIVQPFNQLGTTGVGSFNPELTPRVTLGWVGDCGFGIRARYWVFDHSAPFDFLGAAGSNRIQTHVVDLEGTDRICLGKWIVTGSSGLRYVNFVNQIANPAIPGPLPILASITRDKFEGLGITSSIDIVRPFACNWSFYGNARYSILMGDVENSVAFLGIVVVNDTNRAIRGIAELGTGVQYNRCLGNGMNFVARAGFEAQYWQGFGAPTPPFFNNNNVSDMGFAGITTGAGISY